MTSKPSYTDTPNPDSQCSSTRGGYDIRVKDQLDACWWHWFDGWTVTNLPDGGAVLHNASVDQSALHGALNKIRDLNLTLLSVTRVTKPR